MGLGKFKFYYTDLSFLAAKGLFRNRTTQRAFLPNEKMTEKTLVVAVFVVDRTKKFSTDQKHLYCDGRLHFVMWLEKRRIRACN